MRQVFMDGTDMYVVLHDRIVEAVLFTSVCQNLSPILLSEVTEYPSVVILDFKGQKSGSCCYNQIDLFIRARRSPNIAIMENGSWINSHFQQLQDSIPLRPFAPIARRYGLKQLLSL